MKVCLIGLFIQTSLAFSFKELLKFNVTHRAIVKHYRARAWFHIANMGSIVPASLDFSVKFYPSLLGDHNIIMQPLCSFFSNLIKFTRLALCLGHSRWSTNIRSLCFPSVGCRISLVLGSAGFLSHSIHLDSANRKWLP